MSIKLIHRLKKLFMDPKSRRHALVGPPNLWRMKQDFQIKFLIENGLLDSHKFLDIGCGTLRGGIPIISYLKKGNYYGVDIRDSVLFEAKKELLDANLNHKEPYLILFKDFKDLKITVKLDVIFAFSVLIHFKDDILEKCFDFVGKNISANGIFYANVNLCDVDDNANWQGFPVVGRSLDFYKSMADKSNLSIQNLGTLKDLGHISNVESQDEQIMLAFKSNKQNHYLNRVS